MFQELDKRLQKLVTLSSDNEKESRKNSSSNSENSIQNCVKVQEDGGSRTPYQPSVRILKRDSNSSQNLSNSAKLVNFCSSSGILS